jgi:integrase
MDDMVGAIKGVIEMLTTADDLHPSIANSILNTIDDSNERRVIAQSRNARPTPHDTDTLSTHVSAWIETLRQRVEIKKLSVSHFRTYREMITRFDSFAGKDTPIVSVNETMFERYFNDCAKFFNSNHTRATHLATVKTFIYYLYTHHLIPEIPRNLTDRRLTFKTPATTINTFTTDQIRQLLDKANGQTKLHILIGLNCGYGGKDISDLQQNEIDWTNGVIIRKRSKTKEFDSTPTVSYPLWQPTLELLRRYDSKGNPVLVTKSGGVWAGKELRPDGTIRQINNLAALFKRTMDVCGIEGKGVSFYTLRKTSATLLESHEVYARFVPHFLGHAPATMASRSYAAPSQDLFEKALAWLAEQYGL